MKEDHSFGTQKNITGLTTSLPSVGVTSTPIDHKISLPSVGVTSTPKNKNLIQKIENNNPIQCRKEKSIASKLFPASQIEAMLRACSNKVEDKTEVCDICTLSCSSDPAIRIYPDKNHILPRRCSVCCQKRYCGVAYIVKSECTQGDHPSSTHKSLPHIMYRPDNIRTSPSQELTDCFQQTILQGKVVVTAFDDPTGRKQRDYILFPEKRTSIYESIEVGEGPGSIHRYCREGRVIILHYKYDKEKTLTLPSGGNPEEQSIASDMMLVCWVKRGTHKSHGGFTRTARMDLICSHTLWRSLTEDIKPKLRYIIQLIEDITLVHFRKWNKEEKESKRVMAATSLSKPHVVKYPLILSPMRNAFRCQLIPVSSTLRRRDTKHNYNKITWYIPWESLPADYDKSVHGYAGGAKPIDAVGVPVGITSYTSFFTSDEISLMESKADETDKLAKEGQFTKWRVPNTVHHSFKGGNVARSKFFFGARYLWTQEEMKDPHSAIAEGIRADVAGLPPWITSVVASPLVERGIVPRNFLNSFAINMYHTGSEGLAQHFDCKKRFARPIVTIRLFSSCRLAFDAKEFAMSNPLFYSPLPRGCITVMEKDGYATNNVKHCIRPCDMGGKSGVIILRRIRPHLLQLAKEINEQNQMMEWFSGVGLDCKHYIHKFKEEDVTINSLPYLTECDLKDLGFSKMGPRKLALQGIKRLREEITGIHMPERLSCSCNCAHSVGSCCSPSSQRSREEEVLESGAVVGVIKKRRKKSKKEKKKRRKKRRSSTIENKEPASGQVIFSPKVVKKNTLPNPIRTTLGEIQNKPNILSSPKLVKKETPLNPTHITMVAKKDTLPNPIRTTLGEIQIKPNIPSSSKLVKEDITTRKYVASDGSISGISVKTSEPNNNNNNNGNISIPQTDSAPISVVTPSIVSIPQSPKPAVFTPPQNS